MSQRHPFVISLLSRRDQHPLQAAASLSGEKMFDVSTRAEFSPPKRLARVVFSQLCVPDRDDPSFAHLPEYLTFRKGARVEVVRNARNMLWLKVDWTEKRAEAQFARLFEFELPPALSLEASQALLTRFAKQELVDRGMIADISVQDSGDPSSPLSRKAFALCTTRPFSNGVFQNKTREWNHLQQFYAWRASWFSMLRDTLSSEASATHAYAPWLALCDRFAPQHAMPTNAGGVVPVSDIEASSSAELEQAPQFDRADAPSQPRPRRL